MSNTPSLPDQAILSDKIKNILFHRQAVDNKDMHEIQKRFEEIKANMIATRVPVWDRASPLIDKFGRADWVRVATLSRREAWALYEWSSGDLFEVREVHCSYDPKWYLEYQRLLAGGFAVDEEDESDNDRDLNMNDFVNLFDDIETAGKFESQLLQQDSSVLPPCAQRVQSYHPPTPEYWAWLIDRAKAVLS